jgi:pimeloyl-ACP methyl ester carboxylesterase
MIDKIDASPRYTEMRPGRDGKFQTEWRLTDTKLLDAVRLSLPPTNVIPIIFVPGIMGSNLCDLRNRPVWLLNSVGDIPVGLAWDWSTKKSGVRQVVLHPGRTKVYRRGGVPKKEATNGSNKQDYINRGWGEVSEASYHRFLLWLDEKMNADRNPASWGDFVANMQKDPSNANSNIRALLSGLLMKMRGLPPTAEGSFKIDPVTSDELLKRSKFSFPVYAFGYNWLASNNIAAEDLKGRIEKVIDENNIGAIKCNQVILITHSMGGLVARACSQLPGMLKKIVGIVHGVMPATGAAVAYRRCKVGMMDEDLVAGLVIGSSGKEVTAVFAQSPGALQLLPSEDYGSKWLEVLAPNGNSVLSLPLSDPYEEIYLKKDKWWGLIREEWLSPVEGMPIRWEQFTKNVLAARDFHRKISKHYHHNTYVFYGGGAERASFSKVVWRMKRGILPSTPIAAPSVSEVLNLSGSDVRTNGSNRVFVGGGAILTTTSRGDAPVALATETSHWEIQCEHYNSGGDGTVPSQSGNAPRSGGGRSILQQFELEKIKHEPAYRDYPMAQQIVYYSITKLAAMAEPL